nr:ABC transporter permease subunit [Actinomycetota bacterium]
MNIPDWVGPVAEYVFRVGLVNTLKIAGMALVGSTVIGIVLGTLLTIRFLPLQGLIRFYIEVWRGLPILVTIFMIFFLLPSLS